TSARVDVDSLVRESSVADAGELMGMLLSRMDSAESQVRYARALGGLRAGAEDSTAVEKQSRTALLASLAVRGHLDEAARLTDETGWVMAPQLALLGALPPDSADAIIARATSETPMRESPLLMRWWAERGDTARLRRAVARADTISAPA